MICFLELSISRAGFGNAMNNNMSFLFIFSLAVVSFLLFSSTLCLSYEGRNPQVEALISLRNGLNDPHGVLSNWDEDSVDPCSWSMITCSSDNLVTVIGAPSQGLSGVLSGTIANLTSLKQVLLQNNNFSGHIPKELGNLSSLQTLDLSSNKFSGHVPESLGLLNNLQYLRLNNNSLTGPIPVSLAKVPQLAFLDLSYNNLSGPVPKFPTRAFNVVGNPLICGSQSGQSCSGYLNPGPLAFSINSSNGKSYSKKVATALGVSLSFVVLVLLAVGIVIWRKTKKKKQSILNINDMQEEDLIGLANLRSFTFKELQHATDNFSPKNILGSGGFGNVYRGKLGDGTLVAVKRLKDVTGTAGESQFRTELELISLAVHRNLLRLIGYCAAPSERLLVYPYMSNGSVASRLRGRPTLDWNTRKRIAIGAARGLLYLHEQCDPKIIHRDVKAANVLLDDYYEAIVGDFGLAKLLDHADSHVTTAVRGTVGHIAPEYLSTGQSSEKTDVFGFGILLVELITGMKALEFGKTTNQKGAMLEWVQTNISTVRHAQMANGFNSISLLSNLQVKKIMQEKKFEHLVDRELGSSYDRIDVGEMLQVALLCTQYLPAHRPKMSDVVRMLEGEGLAEKWAASHGYINSSSTTNSHHLLQQGNNQIRVLQQHNNTVLPAHHHVDNVYDNSAMFEMITMDEDYDTNAMELSGPR